MRLKRSGIDPSRRGETLTIEEFAELSNALYKDFYVKRNKVTKCSTFLIRKIYFIQ